MRHERKFLGKASSNRIKNLRTEIDDCLYWLTLFFLSFFFFFFFLFAWPETKSIFHWSISNSVDNTYFHIAPADTPLLWMRKKQSSLHFYKLHVVSSRSLFVHEREENDVGASLTSIILCSKRCASIEKMFHPSLSAESNSMRLTHRSSGEVSIYSSVVIVTNAMQKERKTEARQQWRGTRYLCEWIIFGMTSVLIMSVDSRWTVSTKCLTWSTFASG